MTSKEREFKPYITGRLARLYSVVVPALLLTVFLGAIGKIVECWKALFGFLVSGTFLCESPFN